MAADPGADPEVDTEAELANCGPVNPGMVPCPGPGMIGGVEMFIPFELLLVTVCWRGVPAGADEEVGSGALVGPPGPGTGGCPSTCACCGGLGCPWRRICDPW